MGMVSSEFAYIVCAILIAIYAWDRFNTPPSNRSSTLRVLFWSSCFGYVLSALALFAGLAFLLQAPAWQKLFNLSGQASLPAPLIATLAMTTLLPSVPILKRVDSWLLSVFLDWGAIPVEARRRAEAMMPSTFTVTSVDVAGLCKSYEGGYGDTFTDHLREEGTAGLKRSEYRFTRVVKLYDRVHRLAGDARYRRFFAEAGDEFAALERQIDSFMRRAVTHLDGARRPSGMEGDAAYQELMAEWHSRFAEDCRSHFILLARFLARAALRSEPGEAEIVARLREIGFTEIEPSAALEFPLNQLTILGLGIFGYLIITTIWFSYRNNAAPGAGLLTAGKITLARIVSIGMTVWLLQQFAFFRRETGDPPRYFSHLVNGILGGALAAGVSVLFRIGGDVLFTAEEARIAILSGILCAAVAFCCDDWGEDRPPPVWLRPAEAIGCGLVMTAGTALLWFAGLAPEMHSVSREFLMASWITMPSAMATMIGGYVPHIYRAGRRAAAARRTLAAVRSTLPQDRYLVPIPEAAPQRFDRAA
jgi:type IV secretory pathway TrbD component